MKIIDLLFVTRISGKDFNRAKRLYNDIKGGNVPPFITDRDKLLKSVYTDIALERDRLLGLIEKNTIHNVSAIDRQLMVDKLIEEYDYSYYTHLISTFSTLMKSISATTEQAKFIDAGIEHETIISDRDFDEVHYSNILANYISSIATFDVEVYISKYRVLINNLDKLKNSELVHIYSVINWNEVVTTINKFENFLEHTENKYVIARVE